MTDAAGPDLVTLRRPDLYTLMMDASTLVEVGPGSRAVTLAVMTGGQRQNKSSSRS